MIVVRATTVGKFGISLPDNVLFGPTSTAVALDRKPIEFTRITSPGPAL